MGTLGVLGSWSLMRGTSMGVVAGAAGVLRSDSVRFAPALVTEGTSTWTLRDAIVTACGCDRRAGPLAYWEWQGLHATLDSAREVIARHADISPVTDPEQWANQPTRTLAEVLEVLDAVPVAADVPVPPEVSLRPWCDPKVVSRCRIPYIPLAAIVHAWGDLDRAWSDAVQPFELTAEMSSWDLLRTIEPAIRHETPGDGVAETAWMLRRWKGAVADTVAPARWLHTVIEGDPSITLRQLRDRATDAVAAHDEQT
jgi:hypothetical protein